MLLTPRVGQFAAMALAATEFTAKIFPIRIPRMRQEPNPAPAAADRTACQIRMSAQDGIQRPLILTNKRTDAGVLMPILRIRKEFADGYDKNAKFSARMLMLLSMSPSYSLDAIASRGRAGIFSWFYPDHCSSAHTTDPPPNRHLAHLLCADGHVSLSYHKHPTGKEEPAVTIPDSKTSPNYFFLFPRRDAVTSCLPQSISHNPALPILKNSGPI